MPRRRRVATGGYVFHVLNRATARRRIFESDADFAAFERVLGEALERIPIRLLSFCVMPNHWHLMLWPQKDHDTDLSEFMRWMTVTHTQRWHAAHSTAGTGPLYQGRFKSFPVQDDRTFLTICRYVERNALRAGLVDTAAAWRWCSLRRRIDNDLTIPLSSWPVPCPKNWPQLVDTPQTDAEVAAIQLAIRRGRPFGDALWTAQTAEQLDLTSTLRSRGRPRLPRQ